MATLRGSGALERAEGGPWTSQIGLVQVGNGDRSQETATRSIRDQWIMGTRLGTFNIRSVTVSA